VKLSLLPRAQPWHSLEAALVLLYPASQDGKEGARSLSNSGILPENKLSSR